MSKPLSSIVFLSFSVLGCSAGEADVSKTETPTPTPTQTTTAPPTTTPTPPKLPNVDPGEKGMTVSDALAQKLIGTYAMRASVATIQDLPILGKQPSTSHALAVATIARAGAGLSITELGCRVEIDGSSSSKTTIPDKVPASIPVAPHELRAWEEGGKVKWARPLVITPVGVKLADPAKDALPKDAKDSRVWDQEGDGQPGVTVSVSGIASGDIYIVQRQANALGGELSPSGKLTGLVADTSEQAVIGASNALLNQNIASTLDPDTSKMKVVLVKETAALTCADMLSRKQTIFAGE